MSQRSLALSASQAAALDSDLALRMFSACSDLALLIGDDDRICDVAPGSAVSRLSSTAPEWVGRRWSDVVTSESRPKVEALLQDARAGGHGAARQVNHPEPDGSSIPLLYSAAGLDNTDTVIALGRDLSSMARMQQRLVHAQQTLERDYARLMEMERRYRLLFQVTANGVLIVDAVSGEILEANAAAVQLLAPGALRITGRRFPEGFDRAGVQALTTAMAAAQAQGSVEDVAARRTGEDQACRVAMHLFHEGGSPLLLVRIQPPGRSGLEPAGRARLFVDGLQAGPDAFTAIGLDGRILHANPAFVTAVQATGEEAVRRQPLDRYIGRSSVDVDVLLANLRDGDGRMRGFATTLATETGLSTEVEISAATLPEDDAIGVFIRDISRRPPSAAGPDAATSPDEAVEWVGRLPLKGIVQRSSDRIEERCIRRALELTGDNRAAAAELLGLSRQTLYAKLKRLGLDNGEGDAEAD